MKYSKFKEEECSEKEAETIGSSEQDMYFRETSEVLTQLKAHPELIFILH